MEQCPKCRKMTAEINYYTEELICYNTHCLEDEKERQRIFDLYRVGFPEDKD